MFIIAAAIWISEEAAILYEWKVVGKHGRPFVSRKFCTMLRDADQRKQELLKHNESIILAVRSTFPVRGNPRSRPRTYEANANLISRDAARVLTDGVRLGPVDRVVVFVYRVLR